MRMLDLVGDDHLDVVGRESGVFQRLADAFLQRVDRELVDLPAVHLQGVELAVEAFPASLGDVAFGAWDVEHFPHVPVGVEFLMQALLAGVVRGAEDHGPGGVAEQHAGPPVLPVDDRAQAVRADHRDVFVRAAHDEVVGDRQPGDQPGAGQVQVHRAAGDRADLADHPAGRGRADDVRRHRRADQQVQVLGSDPGVLERLCHPPRPPGRW